MSELDQTLNQQLLEEIEDFEQEFETFKERVKKRTVYFENNKEFMDNNREKVFKNIDEYYDLLLKKIEEKRQNTKEEYTRIEQREK